MSFWVYILRCSDDSYYTGHTDNLEIRIGQHVTGAFPNCYTYSRRPLECVFTQEFPTREEALASEQQIKGWSRKKKEAMIRGDWVEVSRLAHSSVRPEPVEGPGTGFVEGRVVVRQAHHERQASVRPEPVEGRSTK
jgi:predicted GIY-YIG superfamily endonuclease